MEAIFYDLGAWLEGVGAWAYLVAPLIMTGVAVLPIPAELPAMLNGMLFGPLTGGLVTYVGALAGAQISFELSRTLGRPAAERLLKPDVLARADEVVESADWWGLLLPRFMPLVAFTAMNWGAGLTPVSRWRFFWTTAVGILPGAIVFSASGAGLPLLAQRIPWAAGFLAAGLLIYGLVVLRRRNGVQAVG